MSDSFVVDAVRTPVGRINGGLSSVRADDLAAAVRTRLGGILRHVSNRRAVYLSSFVFFIVLAVWAANSLSAVHRFKTP